MEKETFKVGDIVETTTLGAAIPALGIVGLMGVVTEVRTNWTGFVAVVKFGPVEVAVKEGEIRHAD